MRMVDADAIIIDLLDRGIEGVQTDDYAEFCQIVEDAPTVDAVPVVRCKDCKHRPTKPDDYNPITTDGFALEFPDEKCPCQCEDGWYSWYPPDDFFCARGKQKGENE